MVAPLSIIIPTLNAADKIGPTLAALATGIGAGLIRELIIADGGSTDDIATIAEHAGATLLTSAKGRGLQMSSAAASARGSWLLFLHADTILAPGWPGAVRAHLAEHPQMAGYFHLRFDSRGFAPGFVAAWANLRSRLFRLPYGDQGLLIPRDLYQRLGGHPPIALMEDVALSRLLRGNLIPLPATATTSAARYQRRGWFRQGTGNLALLALYFLGVRPGWLARHYR